MTRDGKPRTITELPKEGSVFVDFLESLYLERPASLTASDIWRVNEITLLARDAAERNRVMKL
jgi:hypothetical protein